jgi:Zn finger protein HypA/HybF involved in hydrogenase expression
MQINIDKNLVEFTPENADETAKLQTLWRVMVDCARFNKKMVPVGEYIPQKNSFARFAIEGMESPGVGEYAEIFVDKDCRCYCQTCNKYVMLKKGDRIPPCCGKLMEIMD